MTQNTPRKPNKPSFFGHIRTYTFRGLLAVIPILFCAFAIRLLYVLVDKKVIGFLSNFFPIHKIPGLGILLVVVILYLIGLIVSNFVGHGLLRLLDKISERIPFIKTIYGVGKQVSQGLSAVDGKEDMKKVVLVRLESGMWTPGFVTGAMKSSKEDYLVVLVPTSPTPAGGFVVIVKASDVFDPGWSVEEGLKMIISMGLAIPKSKSFELVERPTSPEKI